VISCKFPFNGISWSLVDTANNPNETKQQIFKCHGKITLHRLLEEKAVVSGMIFISKYIYKYILSTNNFNSARG
jgi:hypothetical protein